MFRFIEKYRHMTRVVIIAVGAGMATAITAPASAQDATGNNRIERFEVGAAPSQAAGSMHMIQIRQVRVQQTGLINVANSESGAVTAVPVRITRQVTRVRISPVNPAALARIQGQGMPGRNVTPRNGMQQAAYAPRETGFRQARLSALPEERKADHGPMFSMSQVMPQDEDDEPRSARATLATTDMIAQVRRGEDRREWQSTQQSGFHPSKANGSLQHGLDWLGDLTGINK